MSGPPRRPERSTMSELAFEPARLRLARELKEWSQADLATRVSVTAAALGQYESGTTRPSPEKLAELSQILDVPAEFFALPVVETHDGFFRLTRRTPVAHRRHARALAHIAHDLATRDAADKALPAVSLPCLPQPDLDAPARPRPERGRTPRIPRHHRLAPAPGHRRRRRILAALPRPARRGPWHRQERPGQIPLRRLTRTRAPRAARRAGLGNEGSRKPGTSLRRRIPHASRRHLQRTSPARRLARPLRPQTPMARPPPPPP